MAMILFLSSSAIAYLAHAPLRARPCSDELAQPSSTAAQHPRNLIADTGTSPALWRRMQNEAVAPLYNDGPMNSHCSNPCTDRALCQQIAASLGVSGNGITSAGWRRGAYPGGCFRDVALNRLVFNPNTDSRSFPSWSDYQHICNCVCPSGSIRVETGSDPAAACESCNAGQYLAAGSTSCSLCIAWTADIDVDPATACTLCPLNSNTNGEEGAINCTCNLGFDLVNGTCKSCFEVGTCAIPLPSITIENLSHPDKINPGSSLSIRSRITTQDDASIFLRWSMWQTLTTGSVQPVNLTSPGVLGSSPDGENLVIRAGALTAGVSYRLRLHASVAASSVVENEVSFTTNEPPDSGTLTVTPSDGMAVNTTFIISATNFFDSDMPLTFRFGYDRAHGHSFLGRTLTASVISTLLPEGVPNANYNYLATVCVSDVYSASTTSHTNVTVAPYQLTDPSGLWSVAVFRAMNASNLTHWHRAAELVNCIAVALNEADDNTTNVTDLKLSRAVLMHDFTAAVANERWTGATFTVEDVEMISGTLELMTLVPGQLSGTVVDATTQLLLDVTKGEGGAPPSISNLASGSIARVSSNVLEADLLSTTPGETYAQREGRHRATVEAVTSVLAAVSHSVAASLVPDQFAVTLETSTFVMQVARINTDSRAAVRTGDQAVVELSAELPADLELQTISWRRNPFASFVADAPFENPAMLVSSRVMTVNVYSAGHILLNVSGLNDTIHVALSMDGIENNLTDGETTCNHTTCVNRYDFAQENQHACSELLESGDYRCHQHFCPSCTHAGYCDKACGIGPCTNRSTNSETNHTSTCQLPATLACGYLDTTINRWRIDGEVVATVDGQVTCRFSHLTDFVAYLGPPPEANALARPSETLNLVHFFRNNPTGVIVSGVSLLLLCATCVCAVQEYRKLLVTKGRDITHGTLERSVYARQQRMLRANDWPIAQLVATHLRTQWTCGSLWVPIEGDPMSKMQRLFVLCATLNICLAANILFFKLGDTEKELCEAAAGSGTNCTTESMVAEQCICKIYACNSPGCNKCSTCTSIASCDHSCQEYQPAGLMITVVTSLITAPAIYVLSSLFRWLHKPLKDALSSNGQPETTSGTRVLQVGNTTTCNAPPDADTPEDVATTLRIHSRKRPFRASLMPYTVAIVFSLGSIWIVASISWKFSSSLTAKWLQSVAATLVLKWIIIDPLKVIVLAPIYGLAQRQRWSKRVMACVNAMCVGSVDPHQFRDTVNLVIQAQSSLRRAQMRLMVERIERVRDRDIQVMMKEHEDNMSKATSQEIQQLLRAKHQRQHQELLDRFAYTQRELAAIVDGRRSAFDSVSSLPTLGECAPDMDEAQQMLHDFAAECENVTMLTIREQQEEARQSLRTRLADACTQRKQAMVEHVAALEIMLNDNSQQQQQQEQEEGFGSVATCRRPDAVESGTKMFSGSQESLQQQRWRVHVHQLMGCLAPKNDLVVEDASNDAIIAVDDVHVDDDDNIPVAESAT